MDAHLTRDLQVLANLMAVCPIKSGTLCRFRGKDSFGAAFGRALIDSCAPLNRFFR